MRYVTVLVVLLIPRLLFGAPGQSEEEKQIKEKAGYLEKSLKAAKTPDRAVLVAEEYLTLSQDAAKLDSYELAIKMTMESDKIAKATKNAGLTGRTQVRLLELKAIKTEYDRVKEKIQTDDAAAGRFYCFFKNDWDAGLPRFAKADVGFKKFAERDLVGTTVPLEMTELGDVWWEIGESNKGLEKERIRSHAMLWYQKVWPTLDTASRARIRSRFVEIYKNPRANPKGCPPIPAEWGASKGTTLSDTYVRSGAYSMQIASNPAATGVWETFRCKWPGMKAGQTYTVSCWALTPGTDGQVVISTSQLNATAVMFGVNDTPYWYRISCEFKATLDGEFALVMAVGIRNGTVWLDDLSVKDDKGNELMVNGGFEGK